MFLLIKFFYNIILDNLLKNSTNHIKQKFQLIFRKICILQNF
jgi:hypothetical protein